MTNTPGENPRRLCVFCASSMGVRDVYTQQTRLFGREMVARGWELVYGGGRVGLMGVVADAVLEAGGVVTGVIPEFMRAREVDHRGITRLEYVDSMHTRKARMASLSDAFVALPGGLGTFEEYLEIVTWAQLGLHVKPCILFDMEGFYQPLVSLLDRAVADGFLKINNRRIIRLCTSVEAIFRELEATEPLRIDSKWTELRKT